MLRWAGGTSVRQEDGFDAALRRIMKWLAINMVEAAMENDGQHDVVEPPRRRVHSCLPALPSQCFCRVGTRPLAPSGCAGYRAAPQYVAPPAHRE